MYNRVGVGSLQTPCSRVRHAELKVSHAELKVSQPDIHPKSGIEGAGVGKMADTRSSEMAFRFLFFPV